MKNRNRRLLLIGLGLLLTALAKDLPPRNNIYAEKGFVHILGPSPAIAPNADLAAVDSAFLESCDVIKERNTYYWYYHAQSKDKKRWPRGYRICVATAPAPLGPWNRYERNPVLDLGPEGNWDQSSVDGAVILKEGAYDIKAGTENYYMWYSASSPRVGNQRGKRSIGLATASSPLGPWKKYERNPVLEDFGYLGGVVKANGKFYMFVQHPVAVTDQGPFRVATADRPEGPWTKYEGNPILVPGDWGAWDDGGYSEARVKYHEGVFHWFYGGTKTPKFESIGYAYSFDGFNWTKYGANPVVDLSRVPDAAGLAEVHAYLEGPYVYLYHTLRYFTGKGTSRGLSSYPSSPWTTEDLAIQVLTIDPHFKIAMPVLSLESLAPRQSSRIQDCLPIGMETASSLALSVECAYVSAARVGLSLHVRGSDDGVNYDTIDLRRFEISLDAGKSVRKTMELSPKVRFVKVIVDNLDESQAVRSVNVKATVGN
ncbi:MAG: hypothetical protein NTY38_09465 [Acidobacteria bacterium]|nr:hypothetical protein [Acidobacteriota bacterium]